MMRVRLRLLLTSFNKSVMDYALARLELAIENPSLTLPRVIDRVGARVRLEGDFSARWPVALAQVRGATADISDGCGAPLRVRRGLTWSRVARAARLARQFAQSIEAIAAESDRGAARDRRL